MNSGMNWVNMKIMDILKSPGLGREKMIAGKAVVLPVQKINSLPQFCRGFEIIPIDNDSPNEQLEGFLKNLNLKML
jgi:hypothetical protein